MYCSFFLFHLMSVQHIHILMTKSLMHSYIRIEREERESALTRHQWCSSFWSFLFRSSPTWTSWGFIRLQLVSRWLCCSSGCSLTPQLAFLFLSSHNAEGCSSRLQSSCIKPRMPWIHVPSCCGSSHWPEAHKTVWTWVQKASLRSSASGTFCSSTTTRFNPSEVCLVFGDWHVLGKTGADSSGF